MTTAARAKAITPTKVTTVYHPTNFLTIATKRTPYSVFLVSVPKYDEDKETWTFDVGIGADLELFKAMVKEAFTNNTPEYVVGKGVVQFDWNKHLSLVSKIPNIETKKTSVEEGKGKGKGKGKG